MAIVTIDLLKHVNVLKISDARHEVDITDTVNVLRISTIAYENINHTVVNNHNILINLDDDDHPQYLNNARGDIRYPAIATVTNHISDLANPHIVTAAQLGLGNVNNTSDANKPISSLTQTALNGKQPLATVLTNTTASFTTVQESELTRLSTVVTTAVSASMDDTAATWRVTATGQTLTLPAASAGRIGNTWTVNLSAVGTLTVVRAGADTIMTSDSATETSVILNVRGMSLDFLCATATSWVIV